MPSPKHPPRLPQGPLLGPTWRLSQASTSCLTFSGHTVQAVQGMGIAAKGQRVRLSLTTGSHRKILPMKSHAPITGQEEPKASQGQRTSAFSESSEWSHCSGDLRA